MTEVLVLRTYISPRLIVGFIRCNDTKCENMMVDPHAIVNFNDFFRARFQPSLPYGTHVAINSNIGHEELKHNAGLILMQEHVRVVAASGEPQSQVSASMRIAVGWAFRILLGRLPESEDVVTLYSRMDSIDALAREIMRSPEFAFRHPSLGRSWGPLPFESQFVITELADGTRFWVNMLDGYVSRAIHAGDYEPSETLFVKHFLKPGMSTLDIGANLGWFSVMMSKIIGPRGAVVAFEPRADLFKYLSKTISENKLTNVKLFNCALGAEQTKAMLRWDPSGVNPGGTQLSPEGVPLNGLASSTVEMKRLDDMVRNPVDFIKIDVEGAEKIVFEGASRLLAKSRPTILAELSPDSLSQVSKVSFSDYLSFLKSLGYGAYILKTDGGIGDMIAQWTFANDALVSAVLLPLT